jgi:hypothetical protein
MTIQIAAAAIADQPILNVAPQVIAAQLCA